MKKVVVLDSFFHDGKLFERGQVVSFEKPVANYFLQMERVSDDETKVAAAEKAAADAAKAAKADAKKTE